MTSNNTRRHLSTVTSRLRSTAVLAVASWLAAATVGGCGSDESDGTSAKCSPGETQACVTENGSGTCDGVQACQSDGKAWGPCACGAGGGAGVGGSGGTSSAGGSAGVSGTTNGGSAGVGGGGVGGSSGTAGMAGSPTDAGPDATMPKPPGPNDDPCLDATDPTPPNYGGIDLNCSDQCQATDTAKCAEYEWCGEPESVVIQHVVIKSAADLPYVIRLPANPPVTQCATCAPYGGAWGLKVMIDAPSGLKWHATVGKPWRIEGGAIGCTGLGGLPGCAKGGSYSAISVGTSDPNAPSRNLIIRNDYPVTGCPGGWVE